MKWKGEICLDMSEVLTVTFASGLLHGIGVSIRDSRSERTGTQEQVLENPVTVLVIRT